MTKSKKFSDILVDVALRDTGLAESPRGSNKGEDIQKYFDSDWYDPNGPKPGDDGYAWCASAMCYWVREAAKVWEERNKRKITFELPRTPAAFGFETWSLAQDRSTWTVKKPAEDIKKGDIVILTASHILIATSDAVAGRFHTIEGNTNDDGSREGYKVARRTRSIGKTVRSRIRFREPIS